MTYLQWLTRREMGLRQPLGTVDQLHRSIYKNMHPYCMWNKDPAVIHEYGAVYNLEFSPNGSMMVAACEKRCVVLFDPITYKQFAIIQPAHRDCVNCIKFLDNRLFATCSDDTTIALWDARRLDKPLRSLHGHANWVKNIEYSQADNLLVTSGFDGSVFTWQINSYTEQGLMYEKVFHMSGLMRCRISPDGTKMVISTTGGYMIIVHDLDLTTLSDDLQGFRPNIYRLMQMGHQYIPYGANFEHIFSHQQKRNRVEFVSDFPAGNDAEVICSLQIHPQGWCALSRNISYDESSEWTTVHDIQECSPSRRDDDDEDDDGDSEYSADEDSAGDTAAKKVKLQNTSNRTAAASSRRAEARRERRRRKHAARSGTGSVATSQRQGQRLRLPIAEQQPLPPISAPHQPDIWAAEMSIGQRNSNTSNHSSRVTSLRSSHVYGITSGVVNADLIAAEVAEALREEEFVEERQQLGSNALPAAASIAANATKPQPNIIQNERRLLNYVQEVNKGKGYIKELCFSADGRVICSPYSNGIRLLAFTPDCAELPDSLHPSGVAQELKQLSYIKSHTDIVVSTKFSPTQPLLASGCLFGKVVWHMPRFG